MALFAVTFRLCYYLGFYPFYYDTRKAIFKVTTTGKILKFINGVTCLALFLTGFLLFYDDVNFLLSKFNDNAYEKWIIFFTYWSVVQYIFVLYSIYVTSKLENVTFLNYCFKTCIEISYTPNVTLFAALCFLLMIMYEVIFLLSYVYFFV